MVASGWATGRPSMEMLCEPMVVDVTVPRGERGDRQPGEAEGEERKERSPREDPEEKKSGPSEGSGVG